jgi:membrane-bound serine protease (ClpP class)
VVGVIMLVFAFFALDVLDTNVAGIVLIVLAFVLILVEIFVVGFGVFGIGAIVSLILGGLLLISDVPGGEEEVSLWLLAVVGAVLVVVGAPLWVLLVRDRRRVRGLPTRLDLVVGKRGFVQRALDPEGTVQVASELWSARSAGADIAEGVEVQVEAAEGLCLIVAPVTTAERPLDVPRAGPAGSLPSSTLPAGPLPTGADVEPGSVEA